MIRSKSGYLSSEHAQRSGQGSADCPWVINVEPGQRINITLLDFHTLDGGTLENEVSDLVVLSILKKKQWHTYGNVPILLE